MGAFKQMYCVLQIFIGGGLCKTRQENLVKPLFYRFFLNNHIYIYSLCDAIRICLDDFDFCIYRILFKVQFPSFIFMLANPNAHQNVIAQ